MHTCISMGAPNRTCTQILSITSVCPLLSLSLSLSLSPSLSLSESSNDGLLVWFIDRSVLFSINHQKHMNCVCLIHVHCVHSFGVILLQEMLWNFKMMTKHVSLMLESSEANIKKSSSDKTVCKTAVTFWKNVFHR